MATFDPAINFGLGTVFLPYVAADISIDLVTGDGARFPDPGVMGAYNVTWWNASAYANPSDDPLREIVRVTAKLVDTLTITRAQEGTAASNKNTALATYKISLGFTKKTYDDITTAINAINPSVWVPMETLTFTSSQAIQTTANFPNASTAKQYLILVDVNTEYVGGNPYIGMRINGQSGASDYRAGQILDDGTIGATNTDTYWRLLLWNTANTQLTGSIILSAQSGNSGRIPVACCLAGTEQSPGRIGNKGYGYVGAAPLYIENLSFLATEDFTGTFKIFQRQ